VLILTVIDTRLTVSLVCSCI